MAVLNTASPVASVGAPIEWPRKIVPSARARTASGRWGSNVGGSCSGFAGSRPGGDLGGPPASATRPPRIGRGATGAWETRGRDGDATGAANEPARLPTAALAESGGTPGAGQGDAFREAILPEGNRSDDALVTQGADLGLAESDFPQHLVGVLAQGGSRPADLAGRIRQPRHHGRHRERGPVGERHPPDHVARPELGIV